jgi:hypothetical protein
VGQLQSAGAVSIENWTDWLVEASETVHVVHLDQLENYLERLRATINTMEIKPLIEIARTIVGFDSNKA